MLSPGSFSAVWLLFLTDASQIALRATNGNLLTAGHGKRAECVEASFQYTYADWRGTE